MPATEIVVVSSASDVKCLMVVFGEYATSRQRVRLVESSNTHSSTRSLHGTEQLFGLVSVPIVVSSSFEKGNRRLEEF